MPRIVRGGGRDQTLDLFASAVANSRPETVPLLLVDSEDPVGAGRSVWQHLQARDHWNRPGGVANDQAFLMVQLMETWFLADRDTLQRYFSAQFAENTLRQWAQLEAASKETVLDVVQRATAKCQKRSAKGKGSVELLGAS